MRIGIAGFGRMGAAMASRVVSEGHQLAVWNRSPERAAAAAALGARILRTPAALALECDVVLSSLFDDVAVRAVYLGDDGFTSAPLNGRLLIDTSTVAPQMGAELARNVAAAGGRFVDAPVLGTVKPARAGALIALAGGASEDIQAARPVLTLISRAIHTLGPNGAGYAGKLAINLLKGTYWAALGDCLRLGRLFGIDPSAILDVIESGPGALVELPAKMPVLRGQQTEPAFDIIGGLKDMRAIVAAGGGPESVPVAAGALRAIERAVEGGWAHRDVAAVALFAAARIVNERNNEQQQTTNTQRIA
jgi:3-hydroxyisobutyrate dehydrogenase